MPLEQLFHLAGAFVLPCWLLLLIVPGWRWTQLLATFAAPLLLATLYVVLLFRGHPPPGAGFNSLHSVQLLFSVPEALLAGWIHYLAFDLFTGAWIARDAVRHRIARLAVAPCLVLTFLFGPAGLASYLLLRFALRRLIGVEATA